MQRALLRFQNLVAQTARAIIPRKTVGQRSLFGSKIDHLRRNKTNKVLKLFPASKMKNSLLNANLLSFGPSMRSYCNLGNTRTSEPCEALLEQAYAFLNQENYDNALKRAIKALAISETPDQIYQAIGAKTTIMEKSGNENWYNEFLVDIKRLDPKSNNFMVLWRLIETILKSEVPNSIEHIQTYFDKANVAFPNNSWITMIFGRIYLGLEKHIEGEYFLRKAVAIDPTNGYAWGTLGLHTGSEEYLQRAKECPDAHITAGSWLSVGVESLLGENNGSIEEGLFLIQRSLMMSPLNEDQINLLGRTSIQLLTQGNVEASEKLLATWIEGSPDLGEPWLLLGNIYHQRDQLNEAEQCFRNAIECDPNLIAAWSSLGNILPPAEGIPMILKAIEMDPDDFAQYGMLASHYEDMNKNELALQAVNKLIELKNDDAPSRRLKSCICAKLQRYREEFLASCQFYTLVEFDPLLEIHSYFAEQRYEEGLTHIRNLIRDHPNEPKLLLQEALYLGMLNQYDAALESVRKAINLQDNDGEWLRQMELKTESVLRACNGKNNVIEMKKVLDQHAMHADMFRYVHHFKFAEILEAKGDLKEAAEQYNLVLEINPDIKRAAERLKVLNQKMSK